VKPLLSKSSQKHQKTEGEFGMKKLAVAMVMMCFVLSVAGLSYAQSASTTAQEKASDNAAFNRKDAKPAGKSNAEKMKGEKEKAVKETGEKGKAAKGKAEKEKTTNKKAAKEQGKAAPDKVKEDLKKQ